MRNTDYFKNKKITIIGLGRSGIASANLLYDLGSDVYVSDNQDNEITRLNLKKLKSKKIKVELGVHSQEFIKNKDLVVVSPGVNNKSPIFSWAREFNIPVISEIELGWILCPGKIIAITGSNGKTTVTTLVGKILEKAKKRVFVCGNIGKPFTEEVSKIKEKDYVSLEVSSFQLEMIDKFKPEISVILNLTYNHLDRYSNLEEYFKAKKRIYMNQDENDYLVLNYDEPLLKECAKETRSKVIYFSESKEFNSNQAAVLAIGEILRIDKDLILDVFQEFKGIPHRLEFVGKINDISFINDSKSTTATSTLWALKNITGKIILIAGGKDKGTNYSLILDIAKKKVKKIILIGQAKEKIKSALYEFSAITEANTLEEAVFKAFSYAEKGDFILLSPMCSSFDMFRDYEERGEIFKKIVYKIIRNKNRNLCVR